MAHRNRGRQRSPIQEAARLEDQGTCLEGLTLDAHVRAQLRGDANLHGSGGLSNPGRVVRTLDENERPAYPHTYSAEALEEARAFYADRNR